MISFALSGYGLSVLAAVIALVGILWSDQVKKRYYDGEERKKWRYWNTSKAATEERIKRREFTGKR